MYFLGGFGLKAVVLRGCFCSLTQEISILEQCHAELWSVALFSLLVRDEALALQSIAFGCLWVVEALDVAS